MAGVRYSMLKSLCTSVKPISKLHSFNPFTNPTKWTNQTLIRSSCYAFVNQDYSKNEFKQLGNASHKLLTSESSVVTQCLKSKSAFSTTYYSPSFQSTISSIPVGSMLTHRSFWSSSGGNVDKPGTVDVPAASSGTNVHVGSSGDVGTDVNDNVKDAWQSAVDVMTYIGQRTKEVSDEFVPFYHQLLDSHPYLKNVIVPVGYTITGTILAWVVMPWLLQKFHKYAMQTPSALLSKSLSGEPIPYEKSVWGALEDPVRYLVTFMAFLNIGSMVAPTTIASEYIAQGWRGAAVLSFVWFLYRWKTNVFSHALGAQSLSLVDKERMLTVDRISSVGLFVIGLMALAEACGVAVQSILTVGGIGGVATAFAAKDILGNVLSGLSMQLSKPFSLGDTIKAGSIEGQVVEMGLTTTKLLSAEKFPVLVPNSLFSSQVIVNKSRAQWRAIVTKIPVTFDDLDKIPQVSDDIKSMLKSNPKIFLEKEDPFCFLSRVESTFAELTIGCNLKHMSKNELYSAEQDILLRSAQILKEHGARLGTTWQDTTH